MTAYLYHIIYSYVEDLESRLERMERAMSKVREFTHITFVSLDATLF